MTPLSSTSPPVRLVDLGTTDWWKTQAVYHYLAEQCSADAPDTIVLCRPKTPYLCLGYHQDFDAVFDRRACAQHNLPVLRRRLGGGATYLDSNQIFYQFIFHKSRVPVYFGEIYRRFLAPAVSTLRRIGLDAHLRMLNEIEIGTRRIAGIGGGQLGEACVVVGNFLLDFDYEMMSRAWRVPTETFRTMARDSMQERIVTLKKLRPDIDPDTLRQVYLEEVVKSFHNNISFSALTSEEERNAKKTYRTLTSPGFLNLHASATDAEPMAELKISAREFIHFRQMQVNGYILSGSFRVREDKIVAVHLDSNPAGDWLAAERHLQGRPLESWQSEIEKVVTHG